MMHAPDTPAASLLSLCLSGHLGDAATADIAAYLDAHPEAASWPGKLAPDRLISTLRSARSAVTFVEPVTTEFLERICELPSAPLTRSWCGGPATASGPSVGIVEIIRLGEYRILQLLGKGGMGSVYLAEHIQMRRKVAVKVINAETLHRPGVSERFLREARLLAELEDPHVVPIFHSGSEDGRLYIVMKLLEGESLAEYLRKETRLSLGETLRIGREACAGLSAAHAKGLIHRDVKPANLFLEGSDRRVVLVDFGLAKEMDNPEVLTAPDRVPGTLVYMAPEQHSCDASALGPAVDVYSLGVTLYEAVTGSRPRLDQSIEEIRDKLHKSLAVDSSTSVSQRIAIIDVLCRALARQPAERFPDARAMGGALDRLNTPEVDDTTVELPIRYTPAIEPQPHSRRQRRLLTSTITGLLLCAVVVSGYFAFRDPSITKTPPDPENKNPLAGPAPIIPDETDSELLRRAKREMIEVRALVQNEFSKRGDTPEAATEYLKDLGPDFSMVGPQNYEKWLAQQGRPTTATKWLQLDHGPFIVLKDEKALSGHPTIQDAINAAILSKGNVIDIHMNGEIDRVVDARLFTGTIRAAPGYRPVLKHGILAFGIEGQAVLNVEGLDIRGRGIHSGRKEHEQEIGFVGRLVNCSLPYVGYFWFANDKQITEIINCVIDEVSARFPPPGEDGATLLIRNSVIGMCGVTGRLDVGLITVDAEHCLFLNRTSACFFIYSGGGNQQGMQTCKVRNCVLRGQGGAIAEAVKGLTWRGERNIYRINPGPVHNGMARIVPAGLNAAKKEYGSDANSLEFETIRTQE